MSMSYVLTRIVPAVVEPTSNADGQHMWWKWVALTLIGLLVLSIGAFAFLIARSFVLEE